MTRSQRGVVKLTFIADAASIPKDLLLADIHTRYMAALVEMADDGSIISPPSVEEGKRALMSAAMLCKEPKFQAWMGCIGEEETAEKLKLALGIDSRSKIKDDEAVRRRFIELRGNFFRERHRE